MDRLCSSMVVVIEIKTQLSTLKREGLLVKIATKSETPRPE